MLKKLMQGGMNAARLNFSHGKANEHIDAISVIRDISQDLDLPVAIIQDLSGPKIRIGRFSQPPVELKRGAEFVLTSRPLVGDRSIVSVNYPRLPQEVPPKTRILLDDGNIALSVRQVVGENIICRVINGGQLSNHKGVNLPGCELGLPALTDKDLADLALGVKAGVDYVAVSFVRSSMDVLTAQREIKRLSGSIPVIAKLETPQAIKHLDAIVDVADGVMVARGDLGVELPPENLPSLQKDIITRANRAGKPVITATQMLESMVQNPRPTRAEASDVANAIYDGSDALMLSAETSIGAYPLKVLSMMKKIITATERDILKLNHSFPTIRQPDSGSPADAVCHAARTAAAQVKARAIVAFTQSGYTALAASKYRPQTPIIAFTPNGSSQRRMSLYWGVVSETMSPVEQLDELLASVRQRLIENYRFHPGDKVVLILGLPLPEHGVTNLLHIYQL
jgi:pyruvate kinase